MEKYLNYDGLIKLWTKTKNQDTLTLNAAKNHTNESISSAKNELQQKINGNSSSITTLNGYFSNGIANKALGDKNGNDITATYMLANLRGAANGVCPLGSDSKIPGAYLPSYVDDVLEYNSYSNFPTTGEAGKIYVAKDTNKTYRWSGTQYTEISSSIALGETTGTAYDGGKGKDLFDRFLIVENNYVVRLSEDAAGNYSQIHNQEGYITINTTYSKYYTDLSIGDFSNGMVIHLYVINNALNEFYNFGMTPDGKIMIGKNKEAIDGDTVLDSSMAITDAELEELLV